jgi:hypothetical protein
MTQHPDPARRLRGLTAAYTDSIRGSDFKANVAIVFPAIMLAPIIEARDKYPPFLPLAFVVLPFLAVAFCLLVCLYPRFPREGRGHFLISGRAQPTDFPITENAVNEIEELQLRCAILSRILFWKTLFLKISLAICLLGVIVGAILFVAAVLSGS